MSERTPAQQRWDQAITKRDFLADAAFQRAEEVGTDVSSLRADFEDDIVRHHKLEGLEQRSKEFGHTVAALAKQMAYAFDCIAALTQTDHDTDSRLNALEQLSTERNVKTMEKEVRDYSNVLSSHYSEIQSTKNTIGSYQKMTDRRIVDLAENLWKHIHALEKTVPSETPPEGETEDKQCECGHSERDHIPSPDCERTYLGDCNKCLCGKFRPITPSEPVVDGGEALDPVLLAIAESYRIWHRQDERSLSTGLKLREAYDIQCGRFPSTTPDTAILAYGVSR